MKKGLHTGCIDEGVSNNHLVSIGKSLKDYTREQALKTIQENQAKRLETTDNNKK